MKYIIQTTICLLFMFGVQPATGQGFEVFAKFSSDVPPGNLAISSEGRIFMSVHEFYGKDVRVVEVFKDGSVKPYPTPKMAAALKSETSGGLNGVLGLNIDENGILWLLDAQTADYAGRLIGWNTKTESLEKIIYLAKPITRDSSFLNDLAIDTKHNAIYIADSGAGPTSAIIVVDLETGKARRVLERTSFTVAEDINMVIDGNVVTLGGNPARIGINPITIDHEAEWVYFGAMTGRSLYRVRTTDLLNEDIAGEDLEKRVVRYGDKPVSDGITIDTAGNVYVTSITDDAIAVVKPDGSYETLFTDDSLSWPDGFAVGPDNYIYATINELHRSPVLNGGDDATIDEFKVIRFKALSDARVGR